MSQQARGVFAPPGRVRLDRAGTAQDTAQARDTARAADTARATDTTRTRDTRDRDTTAAADTAAAAADPAPADSAAATDSVARPPGRLRIGLKTVELPLEIDLVSRLPDPREQRPELRPRIEDWAEGWRDSVARRLEKRRERLWLESRPLPGASRSATPRTRVARDERDDRELTEGRDSLRVGDRGELATDGGERTTEGQGRPSDPQQPEILPEIFDQYADLGMVIQGRVELGGGWQRFRPCDATVQLNCDPSLVPTIRPDIQFGARVGGTITDRIHVNVDYDNRREFDAANNINVFYQGLEDEIVQRIEVGDVSFPLPQSRYLTHGIPAGNFGFRATGQMGPVDFQTVWAQQKGDLGTRELQVGGGGEGFEQDATTILDDADYERGRFFFIFNPRRLSDYPHVDIQRLIATDAPTDLRPATTVKVYRYEAQNIGIGNQIPEGFITATATALDTVTGPSGADTVVVDTLSGLWRPLVPGEDYVLHQSGIWLLLRNTLADREGLAVTYRAVNGEEVGTFNAEEVSDAHSADPENVAPPTLELIKGVNHRPRTATWQREMHHVYRVSGSPGVVASSIDLVVSQGDPEVGNTFRTAPGGAQVEFLKIFGLDDDPTDNRIDGSHIFETGRTNVDVSSGPTGTYIVFPTLEPFRTPPPLQNVAGAVNGEPFPLDAGDRNTTIYDEPNDQIRRGANLYLLTITYRQRFEGFLSTISLGTGGVREGSEKVVIDGQELARGEDYTIDYDVGQIELREPERWFSGNPDARVRVTFEQKPLFQLAPTSVFGLQVRYGLGDHGELNLIGLSQSEKTLQTRPELGLEPSSVQLGGISGRLNFRPDWLTDAVDALPGVEAEAPSEFRIDGELAMSLPNTNTQGVTYVEDFEGGPGFGVSLVSRAWRLGAVPSTVTGAEPVAPPSFDIGNAAELVWQDQYSVQTAEGTQIVGGLRPSQLDTELRIEGQERPEPVLWLTTRQPEDRQLAPASGPTPGPAWRSITSVISPNGQDFTTIEFLEFYVGVADQFADSIDLIVDLGTVSEDAFAIDSLGVGSGGGRLNREVEPPRIWTRNDDVGLWATGCVGQPGVITFPLGDVRANCTRNNGSEDTEDLNQNGVLDSDERYFRYTIDVGDPNSRYFVREANRIAGLGFRLFRIPLRRPDHRERVTDSEFQNIRHLRLTVLSESNATIVVARGRFRGSRWLKRGRAGVIAGLADTVSAGTGTQVEVGPISTLDSRYEPPPGITDEIATRNADQFTIGASGFNEQSLSVRFNQLGADERAEVFLQYAQTPRDFLSYRTLRLWALGIEGDWGVEGQPLRFLAKFGEDARNFYLYKTPLPAVPPDASGATLRQAWQPEVRIDFERFIALRSEAEEILLREGGLPPDSVLEVWDVDVFEDGDSTYAVVISQRSRAPNLAAIRQLSLGVYNGGSVPVAGGELWVDDMRLGAAVDNTGMVGRMNVNLQASDFFGVGFRYSSENPYFRQLGDDPSFRSSREYGLDGRLQFGKVLPSSWGIQMPVNLRYSNASSEPVLLPRTDIMGTRLDGLRNPRTRDLRMDVSLSRRGESTPVVGWLVDNSALRLSYNNRKFQSSRSVTHSDGIGVSYSYRSQIADVSFPLLPDVLDKLLFFLPSGIKDSRLRLTPQSIQFGTSYVNSESEVRRFREIIRLDEDSEVEPVRRLDKRLQTTASLALEPLTDLTGRVAFNQNRELIPTSRLVEGQAARRLLERERGSLAGVDLGWETDRTLTTSFSYRPGIARWLTPQASLDSRFRFNRAASFIDEQDGDTVLTRDFNNARTLRLATGFNAPLLTRALFGEERSGVLGVLLGLVDRLDIVTASWTHSLASDFQRRTARPRLGYQLALGGFDAFQIEQGDSASRVDDTESVTLSSGFRLPLNALLTVDFSQSDRLAWTRVSQSESRRTSWPSVQLNWNRMPIPGFMRRWIQNIGARTGYRVNDTRNVEVNADQLRTTSSRTIPFNFNLSTTGGWTISYNLNLTDDERRDPTGVNLGDEANHTIQLRGLIRLSARDGPFSNPIRGSLRYTRTQRDECRRLGRGREEGATEGCEPFTDLTIQRVDLSLDTDVQPFVLGLQGSWRDTQSELGQRRGSTQLELNLFGQFLLETGEVR